MKTLTLLLSTGVPWALTYFLMDKLPLFGAESSLMKGLAKGLTMTLARRLVSIVLPIVFSGAITGLAVLAGAVPAPLGWPGWIDVIWEYSGLAVLLPQLTHAYVKGRKLSNGGGGG